MKVSYLAALCILFSNGVALAGAERIRIVWTDSPATAAVVAWDQVSGEAPVVRFDTTNRGGDGADYRFAKAPTRVEPYRGMNNHFAALTDLRSDTAYYFVIEDSEGVSERFWFRTAPGLNRPFTFVAGGDTKTTEDLVERSRWTHRAVAKLRPLFAVFNGDFCSDTGTSDAYWRLWLADWFEHTRTSDGRLIPIVPVMGNHEAGDPTVLHKLFDAPYQGDDATAIYYSLDVGSDLFHLVLLNSEVEVGGRQRVWLEADLQNHGRAQFSAVAYHKPLRPHYTGKADQVRQYDEWAGLFYDFGVDLAFEGDTHLHAITYPIRPTDEEGNDEGFIRDDLFGTMYLGEGSWGAQTRPPDDVKPWTLASGEFNQVKWVHVYPSNGETPGWMEIYTVVTGTMEDGQYSEQVSAVGENSEADVFALPENLVLADLPGGEPAVTYPLLRELEGYTFQQAVNGYDRQIEVELDEADAGVDPDAGDADAGAEVTVVRSDQGETRQVLIRFDDIFGEANQQVPAWCEVTRASLRVWVKEGSADGVAVHQMLDGWSVDDTWKSLDGGVSADDTEAARDPLVIDAPVEGAGFHWFDVTESVLTWQAAPDDNHGWVLLGEGDDPLSFYTSGWESERHHPKLIVQCAGPEAPEQDTGEADTGAPEPPPVTVDRKAEQEDSREEPPPSVPLSRPVDTEYRAVSGCQCRAAASPGGPLRVLELLF